MQQAGDKRTHFAELERMQGGLWDYAVVFLDWQNKEMLISNINQIEQAVLDGWNHSVFGEPPKQGKNKNG